MFRLIAIVLVSGYLAAQAPAQESKAEGPTAQTPALPDKTQYPLDSFTDFSAVMIGSMFPGDHLESHIYRSGKLLRTDMLDSDGYAITDLTKFDSYGVSSGGCMHDVRSYFRAFPFNAVRPGYKVERKVTGSETVDGHSCKIEDVTITSPKLPNPTQLRFWEAEDLKGFPVKVELLHPGAPSAIIRYKDIVFGPQDPSLFKHPKPCQGLPQPKPKPQSTPAAKTPPAAPPADSPQK
jgi:hypothetical protein